MALINCSECGNQVSDKAYSCPNCGNPICEPSITKPSVSYSNSTSFPTKNKNNDDFEDEEEDDDDDDFENEDDDLLRCPKCNSTQLTSNKKGFSGGKALTGAVLTGGIGLLAGTIGSGNVTITCLKCGYKYKAGEYAKEKEKFKREAEMFTKMAKGEHSYVGEILISLFFSIVGMIISYNLFSSGWNFFGIIFGIATLICVVTMIFLIYSEITR